MEDGGAAGKVVLTTLVYARPYKLIKWKDNNFQKKAKVKMNVDPIAS